MASCVVMTTGAGVGSSCAVARLNGVPKKRRSHADKMGMSDRLVMRRLMNELI